MKKTQIKDTLRNVRKQIVSYISVIAVAMLAVAAFLGINYAADALIINASDFETNLNFRDIEITSTMLLTDEDIDAIKKTDGVSDVEGIYQTSAKVFGKKEKQSVYVLTETKRISKAEIKEGRLPHSENECAVESEILERQGIKVGDTIEIGSSDVNPAPYLKQRKFLVTGSFLHADHYALEVYVPGNRYVIVTPQAFDTDKLDGCFMKAVVTLDKPENMCIIGSDYDKLSSHGLDVLSELGEKRAPLREVSVKKQAQEDIDKGQVELDEAKEKLENARNELDENAKLISDGNNKLVDAKKQLDSAKSQLESAENKLKDGKAELDKNKTLLDSAETKLNEAGNTLISTFNEIESKKTEIRNDIRNQVESKIKSVFPDYDNSIPWANPTPANINDPSLDAGTFRITNEISINIVRISTDINGAASSMVHRVLDGTEYESEADSVIAQINSALSGTEFFDAANKISQWNEGHDQYI